MKFTLNRLKLDDRVSARVEELVSSDAFIVNFNGDLIRVRNRSQRQLQVGQTLQLRVVGLKPLSFQLDSEEDQRRHFTRRV